MNSGVGEKDIWHGLSVIQEHCTHLPWKGYFIVVRSTSILHRENIYRYICFIVFPFPFHVWPLSVFISHHNTIIASIRGVVLKPNKISVQIPNYSVFSLSR